MSSEELSARLDRIEQLLVALLAREQVKEYYTVEEFARLIGKSDFTAREYCRLGRIHAEKRFSGRGAASGVGDLPSGISAVPERGPAARRGGLRKKLRLAKTRG
jgi:hypothetical protein